MKENIAIPFFRQHICKLFVINAIKRTHSDISNMCEVLARFEITFLRNHWKYVHSLHCVMSIV